MKKSNFRIYDNPGSKSSFPVAKDEHKITIEFTDENDADVFSPDKRNNYGYIVGYLSKEFEYEAHGNYSDIFNVSKADGLLMKAFEEIAQRDIANYGILTKKIFTHGDSPTISIDFRCWAGDAESDARSNLSEFYSPVSIGNALINATLPRIENNDNILVAGPTVTTELVKAGLDVVPNILKNGAGIIGGASQGDLNQIKQSARDLMGNFTSKKPPVCRLTIGNIFKKSFMVVKDVSMKLSKEYYDVGIPLYGDFSVTFQSLFAGSVLGTADKIADDKEMMFGSGLNFSSRNTRVTFDDGSQQSSPSNMQANQKNAPGQGEVRGSFNSPSSTFVAPKSSRGGSSLKLSDEFKVSQ